MDKKAYFYTLIVTLAACGGGETPTSAYTDADSGIPQYSEAGIAPDAPYNKDSSVSPVPDSSTETVPDASIDPDSATDPRDGGQDAATDSSVPDAATDSGTDEPDASTDTPPECTSGSKCEGLTVYTCSGGSWMEQATCSYLCSEGVCTGECVPTTKDCQGITPRTCDASGHWISGSECPYVCQSGICTGACEPGSKDCQGDVPRTCNASGQWVAGSECDYVCSAGSCTGVCEPETKDCQGDVPRTCNSSGQWVNGSECTYVCSAGSCTGVCDPGSHRCSGLASQTCNASGQWVTDTTCPYVCSGEGVCSGVCVPTSKDCQGDIPRTCNSSGQWVSGSECQYVCISGNCSGVCEPGSTRCSEQQIQTCNSQGQWNTASNCPAVPGADSYCSAGACTWDCSLDYDDCDSNPANGCEANLNTSASNCGYCGHSCCGGVCGTGTCNTYTAEIHPYTANTGSYDVNETDIFWSTGTALNKRPRNGGQITTVISGHTDLRAVTAYGSDIFWASSGISTILPGGVFTNDTQRISNELPSKSLIITPADIFYPASTRGFIGYIRRSDGYAGLVTNNNGSPIVNAYVEPFVTDGTYVYAARDIYSSNQRPIVRAPIHGTTETVFVDYTPTNPVAAYNFTSLATDGANLYYILYIGAEPATNGVWRKPFTGGAVTQLVSSGTVTALTTDGENVYYAEPFTKRIRKVATNGGSPSTLFTESNTVTFRALKVIDQCLYWQSSTSGIQAIAVNP